MRSRRGWRQCVWTLRGSVLFPVAAALSLTGCCTKEARSRITAASHQRDRGSHRSAYACCGYYNILQMRRDRKSLISADTD